VPPREHPAFYCSQRFTLNVTRAEMVQMGFSPSVRLFEAAACGVPIISDRWEGIDQFFLPGREILLADKTDQVVEYLRDSSESERARIGAGGRARVLASHTAQHRAHELASYLESAISGSSSQDAGGARRHGGSARRQAAASGIRG
jgi:spore maturation protein CgeB